MDPVLRALCRDVLGSEPERIDVFRQDARGPERATRRLHVRGRAVYATRRDDEQVTAREARILRALAERGAPVPQVLAFENGWLLAESVGPEPLSEKLARCAPDRAAAFLQRAVESLGAVHRAGRAAGLADVVPSFAHGEAMARRLLHALDAVGTLQGVKVPEFDGPGVAELLARPGQHFIKWDARPANAAVGEDGVVRWFDWQHANRRHRADDLVWLLADEFVPEGAGAVLLLVETARTWEGDPTRAIALACAHVGLRLHGILTGPNGLDIPYETCLANDWLGSRASAQRLCRTGAQLAREAAVVRPLADWYRGLEISLRA